VCFVRIALWVLPFTVLRRIVTFFAGGPSHPTGRVSADELSWAVRTAGRFVLHATCLTQAISLHILLRRRGLESQIRVGVRKETGIFEAHAWVESRGRILIGMHEAPTYTPILLWE
jgi:hypothetical protein